MVYSHGISPKLSRQSIIHGLTPHFSNYIFMMFIAFNAHTKLVISLVPEIPKFHGSRQCFPHIRLNCLCCQEEEGLRSLDPGLRCSGRGQSHRHHLSWSLVTASARHASWELEKLLLLSLASFFNTDYIMGNSWKLTKMLILVFVELFLFLGEWGFRVVVDFVGG